jgi:hypothetical protein
MAAAPATELVFTATSFPGAGSVEIANVSVSSIPEPSALTLATFGAIGNLALGCWPAEAVAPVAKRTGLAASV